MVKTNKILFAFAFLVLLSVGFASASDLTFDQTSFGSSTTSVSQGSSSAIFSVNLQNTNETYNITGISFVGATISNPITFLANDSSQQINFSISVPSDSALGVQTYILYAKGNLNESQINSNNITITLNVTRSTENQIIWELCGSDYAPSNISIGEIEDNEEDNENEWEWKPTNDISITVNDIANKVDDDERFDIYLLFYKDGTKVSSSKIASDDEDLEIDNLRIDGEDEEDATFEFKLNGDLEGDYDMYVKVDGKYGCFAKKLSNRILIEKEDGDYSIVTNVEGPTSAGCGESVSLDVEVANIGSDDADQVRITLFNKDLGIKLYKEISDLDEGDEDYVTFAFDIPETALEKMYRFTLYTEFDYDDRDETYDEYSDDEYDYAYSLNILGNCVDTTKPTISATLNSTAVVGEELIINLVIKNNANTATSFTLLADSYSSWADFIGIDPSSITVSSQGTGSTILKLKPTESGQQTFNIKVIYNGKTVDQPVTIKVEPKTSGLGFLNNLINQFGKTTAYLIVAIVILVIVILLVLIIKAIIYLIRKI